MDAVTYMLCNEDAMLVGAGETISTSLSWMQKEFVKVVRSWRVMSFGTEF